MSYDQYVQCLADLLSGDAERITDANAKLYEAALDKGPAQGTPSLALVDAEAVLART
jgi:hypothetical protein